MFCPPFALTNTPKKSFRDWVEMKWESRSEKCAREGDVLRLGNKQLLACAGTVREKDEKKDGNLKYFLKDF